jgi:aerobic carbon-monoxide dehydrogenase small subunit
MQIEFILNGRPTKVEAPPDISLLTLLRDYLGLTGSKEGCSVGECGACAVIMDGRLVNSCLVLAPQAGGSEIITIEGIHAADGAPASGSHASGSYAGPNDMQENFITYGAVQCGICIPGMVMAGEALLLQNPEPTRAEIRTSLAGNLCRCTGYQQIIDAIEATAKGRRRSPVQEVTHA